MDKYPICKWIKLKFKWQNHKVYFKESKSNICKEIRAITAITHATYHHNMPIIPNFYCPILAIKATCLKMDKLQTKMFGSQNLAWARQRQISIRQKTHPSNTNGILLWRVASDTLIKRNLLCVIQKLNQLARYLNTELNQKVPNHPE